MYLYFFSSIIDNDMTALEASVELYKWFSKNDSFCLEEDFSKITLITENLERDKAAFLVALEEFGKMSMLSSSEVNQRKYWVLKKSLSAFPQSVSISVDLAMSMSIVLNKFHEAMEDVISPCDPISLEEKDIKNLLFITNLVIQKNTVDSSGKGE